MFDYWFTNLCDNTWGDGIAVVLYAPGWVSDMYLICERRLIALLEIIDNNWELPF